MKTAARAKIRPLHGEQPFGAAPCTGPGHCPPDDPPSRTNQTKSPRLARRVPPEAERRAFEDAVNGWWWL